MSVKRAATVSVSGFEEALASTKAMFDSIAKAHEDEVQFLKSELERLRSEQHSKPDKNPPAAGKLSGLSTGTTPVGPAVGDDAIFLDLSVSDPVAATDAVTPNRPSRLVLPHNKTQSGTRSNNGERAATIAEEQFEEDFLHIWEAISDGGENGLEVVLGSLNDVRLPPGTEDGLELLSSAGLAVEPVEGRSQPSLRVTSGPCSLDGHISESATTTRLCPSKGGAASNALARWSSPNASSRAAESTETTETTPLLNSIGLTAGDRILEVDGRSYNNAAAMLEALRGPVAQLSAWSGTLYTVPFKGRQWEGGAIHVAAAHPECTGPVVSSLVECRADAHEECRNVAENGESRYVQPIHLAAGSGNMKALKALLQGKADPNAPAKIQKANNPLQHHYYTLHEAAFFDQAATCRELLNFRADVRLTNTFGDTALHMAAKAGAVAVARALTSRQGHDVKEALEVTNAAGMTPLMVAVNHSRFPYEKLHCLAGRKWEDILAVARVSPLAARELLKNQDHSLRHQRSQVHPSWGKCQAEDDTDVVRKWTELMRLSPSSASELLEVMTDTPDIENRTINPLPHRARLSEKAWAMRVCYNEDLTWQVGNGYEPRPWQRDLCPQETPRSLFEKAMCLEADLKLVQCKTRVMRLPNVMRTEVLDKIAHTAELSVFARLSTQAIIQMAWRSIVKQCYSFLILTRIVEMVILIVSCMYPNLSGDPVRFCWSLLFVWLLRDSTYFLSSVLRTIKTRSQEDFVRDMASAEIVPIGTMAWLVMSVDDTFMIGQFNKQLAVVVIIRWLQLGHTISSFRVMGRYLLPIMRSFKPMGGIICITFFTFVGLAMSLLALGDRSVQWDFFAQQIYRLLFLSDDSTVEFVWGLGMKMPPSDADREHEVDLQEEIYSWVFFMICSIGFSICLLNLFIAVHGEAYDSAQEDAEVEFLKERARLCCDVFKLPFFPRRWILFGQRRVRFAVWIYLVSLVVWVALMLVPALKPGCFVASAWLFAGQILTDAVLRQRPWRNHANCAHNPCQMCLDAGYKLQNHIWICHRADYDEINFLMTDTDSHQPRNGLRGRLSSLKGDSASRIGRLAGEVGDLQKVVKELPGQLKAHADEQVKALIAFQSNMRTMMQEVIGKPSSPVLHPKDTRPSSAPRPLDLGAAAGDSSRPSGPAAAVHSSKQPWSAGTSWLDHRP